MRTIQLLMCLLFFAATTASASTMYRAVGATCTESYHSLESSLTNPGDVTVGPKVCADNVVIEITLSHEYVPGSRLSECTGSETGICSSSELFAEQFFFSDGAYSDLLTFGSFMIDHRIIGILPVNAGPGELEVRSPYSTFHQDIDGTWWLNTEGGGLGGVCGMGSIEGQILGSGGGNGYCAPAGRGYSAVGNIVGWERVPEPTSVALLAMGVAMMTRRCKGGRRKAPSGKSGAVKSAIEEA